MRSTLVILVLSTALLIGPFFQTPRTFAEHNTLKPKDRQYFESRGEAVWEAPTDRKVIALTFDDGPDPVQTPQILDILEQYHAKATFFVIGSNVRNYPDIAKRAARDGFELANHTDHHLMINSRTSMQKIQEEIASAQKTIRQVTGQQPHLFRPPGGFYNQNVILSANKEGNLVVMWSWHQDTKDWQKPGVQAIVRKVLNNARNGDIILFHDHVEGKSQTIPALKTIIPELQKRGYRFVTVSELLKIAAFPSKLLSQTIAPIAPNCDVLIDVGHGGVDGGTSYGDILEKDINLEVAQKLYALLRADGYAAVLNRDGDYALSEHNQWLRIRSRHRKDLAQRLHLSKALAPKLLVSLHVNWAATPTPHGPFVLYQKKGWHSLLGAQIMQSALNRYYGTHRAPAVGPRFYVLNLSKHPSMIVEMGYISNPSDRTLMTSAKGQQELASVIRDAVKEYLMLEGMMPGSQKK